MKLQSVFANVGLFLLCSSLITGCNQPVSKKVVTPDVAGAAVASTPMPSPTTESKIVRLGYVNWPGYMPWHVSDKANLFKSDKAKLVPMYYDDNLKGIGALVAGQLDANAQTLLDTVLSVANGSDEVVVLALDNSNGNDKIIVKDGINSLKDLKGKVIATEKATISHYLLLLVLKKAGLTEKDVTIKFFPGQKGSEEFAAGKVDAVSAFTPVTDIALKRVGSKEITSSKDFPGAISDVLSFRRDFIEKNPDIVQATVNNWFETLDYIKANQAKANELMAKRSDVSIADYIKFDKGVKIFHTGENLQAFKPGNDRTSLAFNAEELKKAVVDLGMTTKTADLSKLFDDRFIKAYVAAHK